MQELRQIIKTGSILMVLLLLLLGNASAEVQSEQAAEQLIEPPIRLQHTPFTDRIGFEVTMVTSGILKLFGIGNIYIGSHFPKCERVFNIYVDFRDWADRNLAKRYSKDVSLDSPTICLSDLGAAIPFTQICLKLKELAIMPKGVAGMFAIDFSIGIPTLQVKEQNLELFRFKLGEVSPCFQYTTAETCVAENPYNVTCGWCHTTRHCLEAREDKRGDTCKFCNRCAFSTTASKDDQVKECLSKESCGYCEKDSKCHAGDSIGPFDHAISCDADRSIIDLKETQEKLEAMTMASAPAEELQAVHAQLLALQQESSGWLYSQTHQANTKAILGSIFGILSGILAGIFVTLLLFGIPCIIFMKRKKISVTEVCTTLKPVKRTRGKISSSASSSTSSKPSKPSASKFITKSTTSSTSTPYSKYYSNSSKPSTTPYKKFGPTKV